MKDIDEIRYPELVINLVRSNRFIARADVVKLLHVSEAQAYRLLRKLVDDGQLEAVNKGHYAKYRLRQGG